jgi:hypothetical protein
LLLLFVEVNPIEQLPGLLLAACCSNSSCSESMLGEI